MAKKTHALHLVCFSECLSEVECFGPMRGGLTLVCRLFGATMHVQLQGRNS